MQKIKNFIKKEIVLCVATLLAVISMGVVWPDAEYLSYIDFRTLIILFCLMCVMAGFRHIGMFRYIAEKMLKRVHRPGSIVLLLVMLCFFFSMLITNDVALITFVPFTFEVGRMLGERTYRKMVLPTVVFQTIAANLGSMLTPIGNPQNLYLYGISGMGLGEFMVIMLPYSIMSFVLLLICCVVFGRTLSGGSEELSKGGTVGETAEGIAEETVEGTMEGIAGGTAGKIAEEREIRMDAQDKEGDGELRPGDRVGSLIIYLILFFMCILTVAHLIPIVITFSAVFLGIVITEYKELAHVDYFLLLTFVAFFIFIGNMGRIPAFSNLLQRLITGNEPMAAVIASKCISNVPAALLLSGFPKNVSALLIGTNLGGLGTLIASMASLISYKYVASECETADIPGGKGRYFLQFTVANICFLVILVIFFLFQR